MGTARKGKRDVALLTSGVTSVLSGELKPATLTLTLCHIKYLTKLSVLETRVAVWDLCMTFYTRKSKLSCQLPHS